MSTSDRVQIICLLTECYTRTFKVNEIPKFQFSIYLRSSSHKIRFTTIILATLPRYFIENIYLSQADTSSSLLFPILFAEESKSKDNCLDPLSPCLSAIG